MLENLKKHYFTFDLEHTNQVKPQFDIYIKQISNSVKFRRELSIKEISKLITYPNGYSFCPCLFKNNKRQNENWLQSSCFVLDFDNNSTPEEVLTLCVILGIIPNIIYTSFSDSPQQRKFRVLFFVDKNITNQKCYEKVLNSLMYIFDTADKVCKDFARLYYGGKELININKTLNNFENFVDSINKKTISLEIEDLKEKVLEDSKTEEFSNLNNINYSDYKNVSEVKYLEAHNFTYNYCLKKIGKYVESKRHLFVLTYSCFMNRFGVPFNEMSNLILLEIPNFDLVKSESLYKINKNKFNSKSLSNTITNVLPSNVISKYKLKENQSLSDLNLDFDTIKNNILVAPTGCGKSYWVSSLKGRKIIMLLPSYILTKEFAKRYEGKSFNGDDKDVNNSDNLIYSTYHSYHNLIKQINISEYDVVVDECHNFTTSASETFMLLILNNLIALLKKYSPKSLTFLTATPIRSCEPFLQRDTILIEKVSEKNKKYQFINCKDYKKFVQDTLKESKENNRFFAMLYNNTGVDLNSLVSNLSDYKIDLFSSYLKENGYFKELIETGLFSDDCNGIISTSVLKEGNSFTINGKDLVVIIKGNFHPLEIEQFCARFRNALNIMVYIIKPEKYKFINTYFDPYEIENSNIEESEIFKTAFQKLYDKGSDKSPLNETIKFSSGINTYCLFLEDSETYETNYLQISNLVFQEQISIANKNEEYFNNLFSIYGWVKFDTTLNSTKLSKKDKKVSKEIILKIKEEEKILENSILERFQTIEDFETNYQILKTTKLSKHELEVRTKLDFLFNSCSEVEKTKQLYNQLNTTEKFNRFKRQLKINQILLSKSISKDFNTTIIESIYNTFILNSTYTNKDIVDTLKTIIKKEVEIFDNKIQLKLTDKQLTSLFYDYFETDVSRITLNKKTTKYYTLKNKTIQNLENDFVSNKLLPQLRMVEIF